MIARDNSSASLGRIARSRPLFGRNLMECPPAKSLSNQARYPYREFLPEFSLITII